MKKYIQYSTLLILVSLLIGNMYVFVSSITLSEQINNFEKTTRMLQGANRELENKIDALDSLNFAVSTAAKMEFTRKAQAIYLEIPNYAAHIQNE